MENKIENLCNFIEVDLSQLSTDKKKLNIYVGILRSLNISILKEILKSTFNKDEENEIIVQRLCNDFFLNYDTLKQCDEWYEKVHKYINYFKKILYL